MADQATALQYLDPTGSAGLSWIHGAASFTLGLATVVTALMVTVLVRRAPPEVPHRRVLLALGGFILLLGVMFALDGLVAWGAIASVGDALMGAAAAVAVSVAVATPSVVPDVLRTLGDARVSRRRRDLLGEAHSKLRAVFERLKSMDQLRSQLFANVSHELRTPLTLIAGPLQRLLESQELGDHDRRDLRTALRNARLLQKHVDELVAVATREAGELKLRYVDVDVAQLVRLTCGYFESLAVERGMAYVVVSPETLRAQVDANKLERVLLNVLFNAFKFTPRGGRVRCELVSTETDRDVVVQVADSGPGVPAHLRATIFDRYGQDNAHAARRFGGLGLGLSISRDFLELHGGSIKVDTAPEGGARFVLSVPRIAPAGPEVSVLDLSGPSVAAEAVAEIATAELRLDKDTDPRHEAKAFAKPGAGPTRALVLVVEDNPDMNRLIASSLGEDYEVTQAFDAESGLYRARAFMPDLIISDVMMPGKTGEELVASLRADEELNATPVLVLTGAGSEAIRVRMLRSGAQDFMTKPFVAEELRARVKNLVTAKRARSLLAAAVASQKTDLELLAAEVAQKQRELRTALQATEVARDLAERASRVKGNFLRIMSHELRTPITAMRLQIRLMETRSASKETTRNALAGMTRSSQRLLDLVDTVLEYARIEGGRFESRAESFSMANVVDEVLSEFRTHADNKQLELSAVVVGTVPHLVSDPELVRLIAVNLVGNAVKFTHKGAVTVTMEMAQGSHRLSVTDTGSGIPEDNIIEIFEPFKQLEDIRHREGMGSGLGLAIVREMVQALGGRISVKSVVGVGSTFSVTLPSGPPARPADSPPSPRESANDSH